MDAGLIEMLFSFGAVFAILFWQLILVRMDIARDKRQAAADTKPDSAAER